MRRYLELLTLRGALRAAVPAALARLGFTMTGLALLLTVADDHSYAVAGAVSAAGAVGTAAAGPVLGRVIDRSGPSRPIILLGLLLPLPLAVIAVASPSLGPAVLIMLGLTAGALNPPVGASMRALWPQLTPNAEHRATAYALEATLSELLFIIGPATLAGVVALGGPRAGLVVTAALLAMGAVLYGTASAVVAVQAHRTAASVTAASATTPGAATDRRPIYSRGAWLVLAAVALTAGLSSALVVAVTFYLSLRGLPSSWAGVLIAMESVGSVAGGLWYGSRRWRGDQVWRYVLLLLLLTAATSALPLVAVTQAWPAPPWVILAVLGSLIVIGGLAVAPAGTEEFALVGAMVPAHRMTQAFAGMGSVIAAGAAVGLFVSGLAVDALGGHVALLVPAVFAATALGLTLAGRSVISRALSHRPTEPMGASPVRETPEGIIA